MEKISIVVPCYNEEEAAPLFYEAICKVFAGMPKVRMELIYVNDGSKDGTLAVIKQLSKQDERVNYIHFSRNFGKEAAMYAGMSYATGEYVAIMDVDLQDPPELLPEMLKGIREEGYDCVATRRVSRKGEPPIRSMFARLFYRMMHKISSTEIVDGARDYRLMTRQFVEEILRLGEYNRFSKGLFGWVGFETKWLEYENIERVAGETKWSFWKLLLYSIEGIVGFSTAPLAFAAFVGIFFCMVAFLAICFIVVRTLIHGDPVSGWPSMVCIMVFIGGIQLFCMGILGEYLAKTYLETKHRPIFICKETNMKKDDSREKEANEEKEVNGEKILNREIEEA